METVNSHNNFFYFTLALVFLLLFSAVADSFPSKESHRALQGVILFTEIVAYLSLNLSRRWRVFITFMVVLILIVNGIHELTHWTVAPVISLTTALIFYCGMAYAAAKQVLFSGRIDGNTIVGSICIFLLLGLVILWRGVKE